MHHQSNRKSNRQPHFQIVSIGSGVRDITFYTSQAELLKNPNPDPTRLKLIAFEYGAKIKSDRVQYAFGGGAANTALSFAKLGVRAAVIMAVGDDGTGRELVEHLRAAKVNTRYIQRAALPTGQSFVIVESKTHEHIALVSYGANAALRVTPALLRQFTTDWFYVSSLSTPHWPTILRRLVRTGANIAWNPGATQLQGSVREMRKILSNLAVLILNKDEATELVLRTGWRPLRSNSRRDRRRVLTESAVAAFSITDLAARLYTFGPRRVLITNGRRGSHVYDGSAYYFAKPSPDKPVDTTGAGDCFGSSFIAGLIRFSGDIQQALELAVVNSTSLVSHTGAQQGLLSWSEAAARIKRRRN